MRRIGFNPNTSFKQGKDKIYKIILSTAGINTWPKKEAYKECTLKKFYNTFIRNISTHYDSIVSCEWSYKKHLLVVLLRML